MKLDDLLKLKKDALIPLIRQVAERVRNTETPEKYRRLKEVLLEACDLVACEKVAVHGL